jgi:alpha-L-rhamnosidase
VGRRRNDRDEQAAPGPQPTAELRSIYGPIRSAWTLDAERGKFDWRITVPANTSATVYVPATASAAMREGDVPADESPGVSLLRRETDAAVYEVAAGEYHFTVESESR